MKLDQDTIHSLQQFASSKTEVRLINVYKGLPVAYPGFILSVDGEAMLVKTQRMQVVCLYRDRQTFIQSPLPRIIRADVMDLNIDQSETLLGNFKLVDHIGIRASVRVEPREQLGGEILSERLDLPINCELADISQDGVGLYIDENHYSPVYFAVGQEVIVHLEIPMIKNTLSNTFEPSTLTSEGTGDRYSREGLRGVTSVPSSNWLFTRPVSSSLKTTHRQIAVKGRVVNANYHKRTKRYRTGIKLNQSDPQRNVIGQFIVQRQAEILNEIRAVANSLKS